MARRPRVAAKTFKTLEGALMATRKAHARWTGSLKEGKGSVDFGDGLFKGAYSFTSRFENGAGYVDEELARITSCGTSSNFSLGFRLD
jgi:hypothetical protein